MKNIIEIITNWNENNFKKRYDRVSVEVTGKGIYSIEKINKTNYIVRGMGIDLGRSNGYKADSLEKAKNVIILKITNGVGI